jgi:hypothetical protein
MQLVPVIYHPDENVWWAESPAIEGWSATADTPDHLRLLVEEGVRRALGLDDVLVERSLEYGMLSRAMVVYDFASGQTLLGHPPRAAGAAAATLITAGA